MKNLLLMTVAIILVNKSFSQVGYWANTFPSTTFYTVVSVLGANNTVNGNSSTYLTAGCFASGYSNTINAQANSSHVLGENSKVGGFASFSLGQRVEATSNNSYAIGKYLKANANNAMVIGSGYGSSYLVNSTANSLMIGFNSTVPTLFVSSGTNTAIGKVGIGTTNVNCSSCANYSLFVKGGIKTERIKVEVASVGGWSDYVFSKNYQLLSLDKVETFIKLYSHLPEVPNAEDIVNNGYDMAEMDAILLKKIEELTLYLIELKKENENLKEQLSHN